jgi:hypothetical protein
MLKLSIKQEGAQVPPPATVSNPRTEIWRDTAGAIYAYGEVLGEDCWMHLPGLASFSFTRSGGEIAAAVASGTSRELLLDAYRRKVLPMAVQAGGREILHASSIRSQAGITALCGVSQTGKSTIAFGLSRRGYPLWGDDALAFETSDGGTWAISLPFEIRLRPAPAEFFGDEAVAASTTAGTAEHSPGMETVPLTSVCVLSRGDDSTVPVTVRRLPLAEAFSAILAHACWFRIHDDQDKRRVIDHYLDLASRTPIFDVRFKSGLGNLPAVLDAIEQVLR